MNLRDQKNIAHHSCAIVVCAILTAGIANAATAQDHLPDVPQPDPTQAKVPEGYAVDVAYQGLTYPTSIAFSDEGTKVYIAEAGYSYGDATAVPRLLQVADAGGLEEVSRNFNGPINDLLWHDGKLYISHRGKISVLEDGEARDLVTGLPSEGDHHNNQLTVGPDGKIYFGQGTATNSGVVGVDNYKMGWLPKHPDFHDVPAEMIQLVGKEFTSENPLTEDKDDEAVTGAFQPFGSHEQTEIEGAAKASGTVLRMNADGSGLEVYAWGLRNPYGVMWGPGERLFATENGFDVRGNRPIANDKEDLYVIEQGAWYGWPDYGSGVPVTDSRFKPPGKPAPEFLMEQHPEVEQPYLTFPEHSAATKIAVSPGETFGFADNLFIAFFGHMAPMTGQVSEHGGHRVVRVNLEDKSHETFFSSASHGHGGGGGHGHGDEYAHGGGDENGHGGEDGGHGVGPGPRRLMDVVFGPHDNAMYIVDFGAMIVEKMPKPIPETGVIWRVTKTAS